MPNYHCCADCGCMLGSPDQTCPVCGFDNSYEQHHDYSMEGEYLVNYIPERNPGY